MMNEYIIHCYVTPCWKRAVKNKNETQINYNKNREMKQ